MKDVERIREAIKKLDDDYRAKRKELEAKLRGALADYCIQRFEKVTYSSQAIALTAEYRKRDDWESGSKHPSRCFYVMGVLEDWHQSTGYTNRRHVVEKKRHYDSRIDDWKAYCIEDDELSLAQLEDLAQCLEGYFHPVYADTQYPGRYFSSRDVKTK